MGEPYSRGIAPANHIHANNYRAVSRELIGDRRATDEVVTPPKTIYRQQQPTRLGPLLQTPSVNGSGHSAYSSLSLVTTHHNFLSYAHCFN